LDASYDWHVLLAAPFGSVLKDVPLALHEVLLFRDETHGAAAEDGGQAGNGPAECYAADAPGPRFFARTPDEFLLCFKNDRLFRIQARVQVTAAARSARFAAACADWLKSASAGGVETAESCEGRQDSVHFSGRLDRDSENTVSVTLDGGTDP
jgi:hypothetical protein